MAKKFGLIFGRNDEQEGYDGPSTSISRFPKADIITRELIQNALDASVPGEKTEVAFNLEKIPVKELPFLENYKEAFEATKKLKVHRENDTIDDIEECLRREKIQVLWIKDKGIGLGTGQMNELLKAGKSQKQNKRGSYGLGHLTAFPASTLRYVIYGGCTEKEQILSGQCILASHVINKERRGAKGSICVNEQQEDLFDKEFPKISDLDERFKIWKDKLKGIKREGTGSFVCITAFNDFNNDDDVEKEILHAAASHFMPAIFEEKMEVRFGETLLNRGRLGAALEHKRGRKNRDKNHKYGAAGKTFYRLYECMAGQHQVFDVDVGDGEKVKIYMDNASRENGKQIHLYRDGMWITDTVPNFKESDFSNYKPFTALILVDRERARQVQSLVTKTETERHMEMDLSAFKKSGQKKQLNEVLEKIKSAIRNKAIRISEKGEAVDFIPDFDTGGIEATERQENSRSSTEGDEKKKKKKGGDEEGKDSGGPDKDYAPRPADYLNMPHVVDAVEADGVLIAARVDEKHKNVGVRLVKRSGSDVTCDLPVPDEPVPFLEGTMKGKPIALEQCKSFAVNEEGHDAINIGELDKGELRITLRLATPPLPIGN